jgi:hypothetical protein
MTSVADVSTHRELGEAAWAWVLRQVRQDAYGPWLPDAVRPDGARWQFVEHRPDQWWSVPARLRRPGPGAPAT